MATAREETRAGAKQTLTLIEFICDVKVLFDVIRVHADVIEEGSNKGAGKVHEV